MNGVCLETHMICDSPCGLESELGVISASYPATKVPSMCDASLEQVSSWWLTAGWYRDQRGQCSVC